jgi:hypothetical protein
MADEQVSSDWRPIETWEQSDEVILRPHTIWGAMDVRYKPSLTVDGKVFNWINGDYTTAWPDDAFLPFWMPRPAQPKSTKASDVLGWMDSEGPVTRAPGKPT